MIDSLGCLDLSSTAVDSVSLEFPIQMITSSSSVFQIFQPSAFQVPDHHHEYSGTAAS